MLPHKLFNIASKTLCVINIIAREFQIQFPVHIRVGPAPLFPCPGFVLDLAGIRRNCGTNQRTKYKDDLVLL